MQVDKLSSNGSGVYNQYVMESCKEKEKQFYNPEK